MSNKPSDRNSGQMYNIVVVGGGGVGKSAIITEFQSYTKPCVIDNDVAELGIVEKTAGQEEISAMQEQCMRSGGGFLLVYLVADRSSFDLICRIVKQISLKDRKFPMLMVANKADLNIHEHQISLEENKKQAGKLEVPYMVCSATSGLNVELAFHELVRKIRRFQTLEKPLTSSKEQRAVRRNCALL